MSRPREIFAEAQHTNTDSSPGTLCMPNEWELTTMSRILGLVIREVELRIPRVSTSMSLSKASEG